MEEGLRDRRIGMCVHACMHACIHNAMLFLGSRATQEQCSVVHIAFDPQHFLHLSGTFQTLQTKLGNLPRKFRIWRKTCSWDFMHMCAFNENGHLYSKNFSFKGASTLRFFVLKLVLDSPGQMGQQGSRVQQRQRYRETEIQRKVVLHQNIFYYVPRLI